jgi:quercetin dioxygenase-like cupin family protein
MQTVQEQIAAASESQYRNYQGGYFKVLISPEQTGGAMALIDITLPQGVEPPPHLHTREDETFYLLEGEISFHIGGEIIQAATGQAVFAPRLVPHHFRIMTPEAKFLTLITPGQFLEHFMEYSFPATELRVVPPQGPPPAELIRMMTNQLQQKHGVLFI